MNLAELSSIRTQRSLFRKIPRSFDPPNMSKRRRTSSKRAVGGRRRGSPAPGELGHGMAELLHLQGSAMAEPHSRAPQLGGSGLGHASSFRAFGCISFGFRGFSRSTEVLSMRFLDRCEAIFDTDTTVLVSLDLEVV